MLNCYPTNATLLCDLSDIKFAVILYICLKTDISATVTQIGVKFCMMVNTVPDSFSPLLGRYIQEIAKIQNCGPLQSDYLENHKSKRCMLKSDRRELSKNV